MNSNGKNWSKQDDAYVLEFGLVKSEAELAQQLDRSVESIHRRKIKLGLVNQKTAWTAEEDKYLVDNYLIVSTAQIAKLLNRSIRSVYHRAKDHNLTKGRALTVGHYSEEKIQYLRDHFGTQTHAELAKAMGKTRQSVVRKAYELGLTSKEPADYIWTAEEDQYLLDNWPAKKKPELARDLGRSLAQIIRRLHQQAGSSKNLTTDKFQKGKWTPDEERYLRDNWNIHTYGFIGLHLNRKRHNVMRKANSLGLKRTSEQRAFLAKSPEAITDAMVLRRIDWHTENHAEYLKHPSLIKLTRVYIQAKNKLTEL